MSNQWVLGTTLDDIGSLHRLEHYAHEMKEADRRILYIMPSSSWLQSARRSNQPFLFGTFDDLATQTLQMHKQAFLSLTEQERTLFFQQLLEKDQTNDSRSPKEKAKALSDTYGQLKRLAIQTDSIAYSLEECKPLFVRYEKLTKDQFVLDPENRILLAADFLKNQSFSSEWHVVVDGFYDFSPLQFVLLDALYQAGVKVTVYLPNFTNLAIVDETLEDLKKIGYGIEEYSLKPMPKKTKQVRLVKATSNREQWTGLAQSMNEREDCGVLHSTADKEDWLRAARETNLSVTLPSTKQVGKTCVYKLVDYLLHPFYTQEQESELVSVLLQLLGLSGIAYAKAKQQFTRTGFTDIVEVEDFRTAIREFNRDGIATITDHFQQVIDVLQTMKLAELIERQINTCDQLIDIQHALLEEKVLKQIIEFFKVKVENYSTNEIGMFKVSSSFIHELVKTHFEQKELILEQGLRKGIPSISWQSASLFQGKTLYVPSMGADLFPGLYRLTGYVQEADIYQYDIAYGRPTHAHFRKKQKAYFQQLFYIADELVFSYVEGVDPNHPLLPSLFLDGTKADSTWSFESRMKKEKAQHYYEYTEMLSYWKGRRLAVEHLPDEIAQTENALLRLQTGEEAISEEISLQLNQEPKVSITALESYARCPIRYAFERLLRVTEPEAQTEGISFIQIGNVIHELIEWLYEELDVIGRPFSFLTEQKKQHVPHLISSKIDESWLKVEEDNLHVSKLELNLLKQQWLKRLLLWWEAERKLFWDNEALQDMSIHALEQPLYFDMKLTNGEHIQVTGKIDRIDRLGHEFVIYDYKTGLSTLKMEEVKSGLKLQLPLYSYILRETFERKDASDYKAIGASYISLRAPGQRSNNGIWQEAEIGKQSRFLVSSRCQNRENELGTADFLLKYELTERISDLWHGMRNAFPVKPLDCRDSCPYGPICRVTDEQKEVAAES